MSFDEAIGFLVCTDEEPLIKQLIIDKYRFRFLEKFSYFQLIFTVHHNPLAKDVCRDCCQYGASRVAGGKDYYVELFDFQRNSITDPATIEGSLVLKGLTSPVCCVVSNAEKQIVITGTEDGQVGVWNLQNHKHIFFNIHNA